MTKINEEMSNRINRMKEMMNYGLKTEKKAYSSVEYERVGADGKKYAIIREGAHYHIKVSDKKKALKEDYQYIGGFQNHTANKFDSYANALKHFDMKMRSLNEAYAKNGSAESWNVNGRDQILAEASDKMRQEIARQREIMKNASIIAEGKTSGICKDKAACLEKNNIKMTKPKTGDATKQGGDFYDENPDKEFSDSQKDNIKGKQQPVLENAENEFLDANLDASGQSVGILGGSGGSVNNAPAAGGEQNEAFDADDSEEVDVDVEDEDDDFSTEVEDDELEEFPAEDEEEFEDDMEDVEGEEDDDIAALRGELDSIRATIEAMASKLGVSEFDKDETLYPEDEEDSDDDSEDDEEVEYETEIDMDDDDDEEEEDEDVTVYESRAYRAVMQEGKKTDAVKKFGAKVKKGVKNALKKYNDFCDKADEAENPSQVDWDELKKDVKGTVKKTVDSMRGKKAKKDVNEGTVLHDFGKHPGYQKQPMTYPTPEMAKTEGQYEEGADEDNTNKPFGTEIGDSTPFGDGEKAKVALNSIAESIIRRLTSKNG